MTQSRPTRRRFLGSAAATLAGPFALSQHLQARSRVPASERLTMGLIGCGGMGNANLNSFLHKDVVQVVATCDPDRGRREASASNVERFYGDGQKSGDWKGVDHYNDFRDLLARADIDAVIIGSPDHWHALHTVFAARAGKDIYGEKPLSLTIRQGRVMSDTVKRYGRVFQTGSQQRSDPRFRLACELVRNGRIGTVRKVTCGLPPGETTGLHAAKPPPEGFDYDLWLGPAPAEPYCDYRTHYVFRHILDYSGGKLTDWGAHHVDIAQWALGTMETGPVNVKGKGEYPQDGLWDAPEHYDVECTYANGVEMLITSRTENGVKFEGDDGWLFVSRSRIEASNPAVLDQPALMHEDKLFVSNDHHQNFLDCVVSREQPVAPIEHAHRSIAIAHLGNIAMKVGRPLKWDPVAEDFIDDAAASAHLDRPMRAPWSL